VFAEEELEQLDACDNREVLRWSMWAAKEAAYKLLKARHASVVFSPSRFVVRPDGHNAATVEVADVHLRVDFQTTPAYVHAIARQEPVTCPVPRRQVRQLAVSSREATAAAVAMHGGDAIPASVAVRQLAVTSVARLLGEEPAGLSVGSDGRVPILLRGGRRVPGSLSLSHHGRFVAFAWSPSGTRT
jgi:phosphopantetheinyl transferase (holo-ACP synthase)